MSTAYERLLALLSGEPALSDETVCSLCAQLWIRGRSGFLSWLQSHGVERLPTRQALTNAVSGAARCRALPSPTASELSSRTRRVVSRAANRVRVFALNGLAADYPDNRAWLLDALQRLPQREDSTLDICCCYNGTAETLPALRTALLLLQGRFDDCLLAASPRELRVPAAGCPAIRGHCGWRLSAEAAAPSDSAQMLLAVQASQRSCFEQSSSQCNPWLALMQTLHIFNAPLSVATSCCTADLR